MIPKLNEAERAALAVTLPRWQICAGRDAIAREFVFRDFNTAFGFMCRVALLAERQDHHPEWSNVWNRVTVDLSTHDAGGITKKDFELARLLEGMAKKLLA